jgi:hypothetical protein
LVLKGFKIMCLKLENFDKLTVDLDDKKKKGNSKKDLKRSEEVDGKAPMGTHETSRFDLDLDGSILCGKDPNGKPWNFDEEACRELNLDEVIAGDTLALLEKNLRTWNSMRDLLKRECMAQAPMVESTLVLTILVPVVFLFGIAHEFLYAKQESWLTTFNAVACLQVTVFTGFAFEALLLCVNANASFDMHNDIVAKNKESFLRRRRETVGDGSAEEKALADARKTLANRVAEARKAAAADPSDGKLAKEVAEAESSQLPQEVDQVLNYVKYLHISNVMDTMIQKIETKDVPITLLTVKVNRQLQGQALAACASYVFALGCLVAQQSDLMVRLEKSLTDL